VFVGILVYQSKRIASDDTAKTNHNLSVTICYKAGIGIKMESNCVINRSCKISLPVPVIDGLTLGVEEGEGLLRDEVVGPGVFFGGDALVEFPGGVFGDGVGEGASSANASAATSAARRMISPESRIALPIDFEAGDQQVRSLPLRHDHEY